MPERMNWRRKKPIRGHGTGQPVWRLIANLGDADPFSYGGYFVYRDETGVFPEFAELLVVDDEGEEDSTYTIYRFDIDPLKMVNGYLVSSHWEPSWPHPLETYDEWFHEDLKSVADYVGSTKEALERALTSRDPLERAQAYRAVGEYHGWDNFDSDPLTGVTLRQVRMRYSEELDRLRTRNR